MGMSLRIIMGRAASGKSEMVLREIRQEMERDPMGPPLIYLVPDQMSFQAERALLKEDLPGMIRAQVYSFRRFAQRLFTEVGGDTKEPVTPLGVKLLLYQSLYRHQEELKHFRQGVDKPGFGDRLHDLFLEFRRYGVSPEGVERLSASFLQKEAGRLLGEKLSDFSLLYDEVLSRLEGKYIDSEETLRLLAQKILAYPPLREAKVWVDGFVRFTPQEMGVLVSLMTTAQQVSVALPAGDGDLFQIPVLMAERLGGLAKKAKVPVTVERKEGYVRSGDPALRHLADHYEEHGAPPLPALPQGISLAEAVNRRAEVEWAARTIREWVRTGRARWREIQVLTGDMATYSPHIQTIFADDEIPFFLDERRPMLHHPLVELIRSAFEVIADGWPSEALFRMVKTDLFPAGGSGTGDAERVRNRYDRLENLILEYGITGTRWKEPFWGFTAPDERIKREEPLRVRIAGPLTDLEKRIKGSRRVKDVMIALEDFLSGLKVPERLEAWMEEALAAGSPEEARSHEQVWQAYLALVDQMVEVLGEEEMAPSLLFTLFEKGLLEQNFALIPPAMDQVIVGTLSRTRLFPPKLLILLGVNDGLIPGIPGDQGLILDGERQRIAEEGVLLAPPLEERMLEEELMLYLAVTRPTEHLALSYALADEEGRSLSPSSFIFRLRRLFPALQPVLCTVSPEGRRGEESAFISHPRRTLSHLVARLREWRKGYPLHPIWLYVYHWFLRTPAWEGSLASLVRSLDYRNQERGMRKATAKRLYGNPIRGSISRLERFYACPFSHFAGYGLQLRERKRYRLELADIGTLFHEALRLISSELQGKGTGWGNLSDADLSELVGRSVEAVSQSVQHQIFLSSNRYRYLRRRLERVVRSSAHTLNKHGAQSLFQTEAVELTFGGEEKGLPAIQIPLGKGMMMELTGRIDRVDLASLGGGTYVRILDYKSSAHAIDLSEVYYGLSLQMLTYLGTLLHLAPEWLGKEVIPAGILYFYVHQPLLTLPMGTEEERVAAERLKRYKMAGLILADTEVVRAMDTGLVNGYSKMIPVGLTQKGTFYSNSKVVSQAELERLLAHVNHLIRQAGEAILAGEASISPFQFKKRTACTFCPYRPVCQFDWQLEENRPRLLRVVKEKDWLASVGEGAPMASEKGIGPE